ncbi:hypothetical protein K3758_02445 [Sulfitobacter sp. W002]|uniref:hypothetical protein n=1 Tax=Sulfitobacter sp. W002 TaxID=2867024 RepID=UPI0021A3717E|nr:hypothetical protein [Sulfitobacter sp. W002]UWR30410.1 hypothetical protein K3758_02445 [Sulfitobacter sp. W002]
MNQITTTRPTPRNDRQQKTGDPVAVDPAPSACDIALEGMIVLLARHISREMTSVDGPQDGTGNAKRQRINKIGR